MQNEINVNEWVCGFMEKTVFWIDFQTLLKDSKVSPCQVKDSFHKTVQQKQIFSW